MNEHTGITETGFRFPRDNRHILSKFPPQLSSKQLTPFLQDPLMNWLPYTWKKYIPAWHIIQSYRNTVQKEGSPC